MNLQKVHMQQFCHCIIRNLEMLQLVFATNLEDRQMEDFHLNHLQYFEEASILLQIRL